LRLAPGASLVDAGLAEAAMRIVHRRRPGRSEVDPAALELIARHGSQILATARRYSSTPEDAEDAYQRGLEILLTKAPTTREEELVPWLKTVVKHEAFAIRRQRERHTPTSDDGHLAEPPTADAATHDQAERLERLRQGAEAMGRLKPQEIRCLLLKAEGFSYREICDRTGFSYTKVNRCLTEGRRAFVERLAGIEAGSECERLRPLVSLLADGELSGDELRCLRPHLKSCLACRALLAEYRAVPPRVAALLPPAALVAAAGGGDGGAVRGALESLLGTAQERVAALGERAHAATELGTGGKLAAVAASAAALAGGGATVGQLNGPDGTPQRDQPMQIAPVKHDDAEPQRDEPVAQAPAAPAPTPREQPAAAPPRATTAPAPPPPLDPANEFAPDAAPAQAPAAARRPAASRGEVGPSGGGGGGGGGEFGP
jgi:RNA polymerase sigma factor (sigma-70 family)